ncbi:hypothetical protein P691DRAFT_740246 [Macrolepiota fuliginosa MF-IS2]|uniref:Nephrocystin 3-like N-terminal domain-containing protein n=1 Tax=Macrolepiota fuliginosa MF-IS2 TaxID=1400762 RepID=A0A9P5WXB5_9AGAR|nr:hypothetical protein P691DRAFT_740246 [Macrolepiota fuliginosa MF-IS2]
MDWLYHILPRASDFIESYASELNKGEEELTLPEQGIIKPSSTPLKGPHAVTSQLKHSREVHHVCEPRKLSPGHILGNTLPVLCRAEGADSLFNNGRDNQRPQNITILRDMLRHALPGARYNSLARDPPPRCLPGTRVHILEDIDTRIRDKDARIIWLRGPAGSGKSAIMQTLAEVQSSRTVLATLFLSRDHECNDPKKILISLAYSFAILNPTYCQLIEERINLDPDFLSLCMDEQFKCLFVEPFMHHIVQDAQRWVIVLDGLGECRGEADQCRIVDLIRNSIHLHPQSPLLWIISSRPDTHMMASFSRVKDCVAGFWEQEIPIDSLDASEDVNRFLHTEFAKIRELHCDSMPAPPSIWPSDEEFLQLSQLSSGFFGFAFSAMKHVASANPISRLQHILSSSCPLDPLDLMYTQIMSKIPSDVLSNAKEILGFYALHRTSSPVYHSSPNDNRGVGFLTLCNILQMQKHSAYAALRQLSSVLIIPSPMTAKGLGIKFVHPSFLQFLEDPARSGSYNVGLDKQLTRLWNCYLRILRQYKKAGCTPVISYLHLILLNHKSVQRYRPALATA